MDAEAIDRFRRQRDQIDALMQLARGERTEAQAFQKWRRRTATLIRRVLGPDSREAQDFDALSFIPRVPRVFVVGQPTKRPDPVEPFLRGCRMAQVLLEAIIEDADDYGPPESEPVRDDPLNRVTTDLGSLS